MQKNTVFCEDCGAEIRLDDAIEQIVVESAGFQPDGSEMLVATDRRTYQCHPCWAVELDQVFADAGYEEE